jgi:hypothetical protein
VLPESQSGLVLEPPNLSLKFSKFLVVLLW